MSTYKTRFPLMGAIVIRVAADAIIRGVEVESGIPSLVIEGAEPTEQTPAGAVRRVTFGAYQAENVFDDIREAESELGRRYREALANRPEGAVGPELGMLLTGCIVRDEQLREIGRIEIEDPVKGEWIVFERVSAISSES